MGSKCMPQRVRTDFLTNATSFTSPLDNIEDHYSGELCPPAIQKQNILVVPLYIEGSPIIYIRTNFFNRFLWNRNQPLLFTLTFHDDITIVKIEVGHTKPHQFGNTKATTIQCFYNRSIAAFFRFRQVERVNQLVHLLYCQHVGQFHTQFRSLYQFRRIRIDAFLHSQKIEKRFYPRNNTSLRPCTDTQIL